VSMARLDYLRFIFARWHTRHRACNAHELLCAS
jgi:hypothetical protein